MSVKDIWGWSVASVLVLAIVALIIAFIVYIFQEK